MLALAVLATVAAVVAFIWFRPAPEPSWLASCETLSQTTREALASGDLDQAEWNLAQAAATCQDHRLDALSPLADQVAAGRTREATCNGIQEQASAMIERSLPGQAERQLADARGTCAGHAAYEAAVGQSTRNVREAVDLVSRASQQLANADIRAADASLTQALRLDSQVYGAAQLSQSIAQAQRQAEDAAALAAPPPPTWQEPAPAPARAGADAIVGELLNDGRHALARGNYAEAKSHAKSALRLSPGHRAASELLSRAEAEERRALQEIIIN